MLPGPGEDPAPRAGLGSAQLAGAAGRAGQGQRFHDVVVLPQPARRTPPRPAPRLAAVVDGQGSTVRRRRTGRAREARGLRRRERHRWRSRRWRSTRASGAAHGRSPDSHRFRRGRGHRPRVGAFRSRASAHHDAAGRVGVCLPWARAAPARARPAHDQPEGTLPSIIIKLGIQDRLHRRVNRQLPVSY